MVTDPGGAGAAVRSTDASSPPWRSSIAEPMKTKQMETKSQPVGKLAPVSVAALAGVSGAMQVEAQGNPLGTIFVDRGRVWVDGGAESRADVVAIVDEQA